MCLFRCLQSLLNSFAPQFQNVRSCSSSVGLNSFTFRTHHCGELRLNHVGRTVTLCGWLVYNRLNMILVLRDAYGITQTILGEEFDRSTLAIRKLTFESVLQITGTVRQRPEGQSNPKMPTGDVEVHAHDVKVLNECKKHLPFGVKEYHAVEETLRMRYRYLALRHSTMQSNLRLRSEVVQRMREYLLNEAGFVEVETPTLFKRTPGGAAEFPVPCSKHPGLFYSLPQSPQQFKQLLMVGGVDRYFQLARCYRDERVSPDRQPEFTQIDLELSFTTQNEVMRLIETLLSKSWPNGLPALSTPFATMRYADALRLYGTDKPDVRFDMLLICLNDYFENQLFDAKSMQSSPPLDWSRDSVYCIVIKNGVEQLSSDILEKYERLAKNQLHYCPFLLVNMQSDGRWSEETTVLNLLSETKKLELKNNLHVASGDSVLLCSGPTVRVQKTLGQLRLWIQNHLEETNAVSSRGSGFHFLWITEFPLFVFDEQSNAIESAHHPFTAPIVEHQHLISEDPLNVSAQHYDLVLNGVELGGGSIRIHNAEMQRYVLENVLLESADPMRHLLDALASGAPPHGGIALGLDRYLAILCNCNSIRDVIAFPKSHEGFDMMADCPSALSQNVLDRFHIAVAAKANAS